MGYRDISRRKKKVDIINSCAYKGANEMFKACLVQVKKEGNGETKHKEIISDDDLKKLYSSGVLDINNPKSLQNKVFFELMLYFCHRGRENLRDMKPGDFEIFTDAQGMRYVKQTKSKLTKNHTGENILDDDDKSARMYEKPGDENCPVTSFEKFLSKLNPANDYMWQRPKDKYSDQGTWYDNSPLGKNTLGQMMQNISKEADLSTVYSNHCIRATCITLLDESGCQARHIMGVSGHKSETSIKHYASRLSEKKKREISCTITSKVLCSTGNDISDTGTSNYTVDTDFLEMEDSDLVSVLESIENNSMTTCQNTASDTVLKHKSHTGQYQPVFNFNNSTVTINYH